VSFSARLETPGSTVGQQPSQSAQAVASCAAACRQDCSELIRLTTKLQVDGGSGRASRSWKSFRAALTEVWKSSEIEDLKARIADRQQLMALQLCAISRYALPSPKGQGCPQLIAESARVCKASTRSFGNLETSPAF
jgi:hypothetical protein